MSTRALLIDDDPRLSELLGSYLGQNGITVAHAPDGGRGLAMLEGSAYDVVLLDVMMPGIDGLEVCKRIREKSSVPVLMLTAKGDETDRVVGLELGADDYIAKPFSPKELVARVRAVLRRTASASGGGGPEVVRVGDVEVDVPRMRVRVGGRRVDLTPTEFQLF